MPNLRTSALICGSAFALIVAIGVAGNLNAATVQANPGLQLASRIVFFTLVAVFALAMVPLMVNAVFDAQPSLRGVTGVARVAIVWALWALMGLGAAIAIPAAILAGAFGDAGGALNKVAPSKSQGTLTVGIGMTVPDVRRASTLALSDEAGRYSTFSGTGIFEVRIAGSPTVFRKCRLYFISLDDKTRRISQVHLAIVPEKLSAAELEQFLARARAQLRADGWAPRPYDKFVRGGVTLDLGRDRMDERHAGDGPDAGEWIATADLWPSKSAP